MASAIVYCPSGGGKTVNATMVEAPSKGKNLLICTDNSWVVLNNFDRKNLDIEKVSEIKDMAADGTGKPLIDRMIESGKYDNIIVDNLSDYFDLCITEMQSSGKFKDVRQAYQLVYQQMKLMARKSSKHDCNVIFTAWSDMVEVTQPDGEKVMRIGPKLAPKILDNMCGLVNVVAYINTTGAGAEKKWYYVLEGSPSLVAKDQLYCRRSCNPNDLFLRPQAKKEDK